MIVRLCFLGSESQRPASGTAIINFWADDVVRFRASIQLLSKSGRPNPA
jgi:hypothetical protein